MNMPITAIVTPVFNDWESLRNLINDIDLNLVGIASSVMIFVVNDGSTTVFSGFNNVSQKFKSIKHVEILHLARNVGHQRAIAVGLAYVEKNFQAERVIVMDADGEDSPVDLPRMIDKQVKTGKIVFARRGKRKESIAFRIYYIAYRMLFYFLTGKKINFGNFSVIPGDVLRQIVFLPEIWGHFASAVLRSGLPYHAIVVDRQKRYHGKTKMNFLSLFLHGLSAFSVYSDIMAVRLVLFTLFVILAIVLGAVALLYVKYFTGLAIPGWATTVGLGLTMILLQAFLLLLSLVFNILNSRSLQTNIPAKYFDDFLLRVEVIYE